MKSISYAGDEFNSERCYLIRKEIEKLSNYFWKCCKGDVTEAKENVFHHAMKHFDPLKGELTYYLRSLARDAGKRDPHFTPCDFLEEAFSEDLERYGKCGRCTIDVTDFSVTEAVVNKVDSEIDRYEEIVTLALSNMNLFCVMCCSLIGRNTSTHYFPDSFKLEVLKLSERVKDFNKICLSIYKKYGDDFNKFMSNSGDSWHELDAGMNTKSMSKRIKLVRQGTGDTVANPDVESWSVQGTLSGKKIFKVPYLELYDYVMELVDDEATNPLKFCIGDSYIFRSLGGSLSSCNSSLFTQYNIVLQEIVTNCLYDLSARYITCGSECLYFLVPPCRGSSDKFPIIPKRVIRGIEVNLIAHDVTPADAI